MSAGSESSNIGYGNQAPLSNINGKFVNVDNSHSPSIFGSNVISGLPGLAGAKNNVDAAMGYVPGICIYKGGMKKLKRKINKITRVYKMKNKSIKSRNKRKLKLKYTKRRFRSYPKRSRLNKKRYYSRKRRTYKGGYSALAGHIPYPPGYAQYQNNLPNTNTYSLGGKLSPDNSALANPPPLKSFNTCVDNYNHFTGKGFPSRGH